MKENEVRTIIGEIINDKVDKTVTVNVTRVKTHRLYKKKFSVSKKYLVDDAKNEYKIGDIVEIIGVRPISKNKCYKVLRKVEK
jgi:small subunit ribosomal protein S17